MFNCVVFTLCLRCIFTGTLVVVPDVGAFARSGEKSETIRGQGDGKGDRGGEGRSQAGGDGVRGLKALGVRELNYKLAFLASSVQVNFLLKITRNFLEV